MVLGRFGRREIGSSCRSYEVMRERSWGLIFWMDHDAELLLVGSIRHWNFGNDRNRNNNVCFHTYFIIIWQVDRHAFVIIFHALRNSPLCMQTQHRLQRQSPLRRLHRFLLSSCPIPSIRPHHLLPRRRTTMIFLLLYCWQPRCIVGWKVSTLFTQATHPMVGMVSRTFASMGNDDNDVAAFSS